MYPVPSEKLLQSTKETIRNTRLISKCYMHVTVNKIGEIKISKLKMPTNKKKLMLSV